MKYTALIGNKEVEVELGNGSLAPVRARIAGRNYEVTLHEVEPGVFWFSDGDRSVEAAVIANAEGYTVAMGSRYVKLELLDGRSVLRQPAQLGHGGLAELHAAMPGKVVKILVEEGSTVKANQGIVVIEAMKMQNEMRSPKAGTVQKIPVEEGTTVAAGALLAVVE